jgi:hypothetical protein
VYNVVITFPAGDLKAALELVESWHLPEGSVVVQLHETPKVYSAHVVDTVGHLAVEAVN